MTEPDPASEHRKQGEGSWGVALVTVSTSRAREQDRSGDAMDRLVREAGHRVPDRRIVPDDAQAIRGAAEELLDLEDVDAVIFSGGTGLSPSDCTVEAVSPLFTRPIPAFSVLFTQISYDEVAGAAMLSRAAAGLAGRKVVFCLPGSPKAVALALEKLILPELGHLLGQARRER